MDNIEVKEILMKLLRPQLLMLALLVASTVPLTVGQTVSTLYSFSGQGSSGMPEGTTPSQARDGKLYGADFGPNGSGGSIFKITTTGLETQIYTFGSDGTNPVAGLTLGTDGNFYGTTLYGGSANSGVLFKVTPSGTYTVLHEFQGDSDGAFPVAPPIQASDGNFYGSTSGTSGASTIYKYTASGSFSTIFSFNQTQGQYAAGALTQGTDDNLYGTAEIGGANLCGTLFKMTTAGTLLWSYSFPCGTGGAVPVGSLLQANDGSFYGVTVQGGLSIGCGTAFKLDQAGNVSTLYAFKNITDGCGPEGGVSQGTDGNLYGTTQFGGTHDQGTLYQLTTGRVHTILYSFGGTGKQPLAAPIQDTNGKFYGTTNVGGRSGNGTIYSLDMGLGSFIAFVRPKGAVGGTAQILSQGLTGATGVTFNGTAATSFKVVNDTYMTAVVPSGATTGPVVVTTPGGTLTSNVSFRILQ
jgi:uncharacterized repeat protein (TIGR03803 family)